MREWSGWECTGQMTSCRRSGRCGPDCATAAARLASAGAGGAAVSRTTCWKTGTRWGRREQFLRRDPRALGERLELCPHDAGVDLPCVREIRKTAVRAGDHVLTADHLGETADALRNQLRVLDQHR